MQRVQATAKMLARMQTGWLRTQTLHNAYPRREVYEPRQQI